MSKLFNDLPEGCFHFAGYLDARDQARCLELCRILVQTHPLVTPTTKSGHPMALQVTSWGLAGWFGRNGKYEYLKEHPITHQPWPDIPMTIVRLMQEARILAKFPSFDLQTVLLNWYPAGTGRLGLHRDVTEEDQESPIITISLGDSAVFAIGGLEYGDKKRRIELRSGDIFVMGGPSRLLFHEIEKLIPSENPLFPKGGRISLTGRKVFK